MTMDPSIKGSIERTKRQVEEAPLPDDSQERLLRIIDKAAAATNGSPDKIQALSELMLENILLNAHNQATEAVRVRTLVTEKMEAHINACPMRGVTKTAPKWLLSIYPLRWQMTVVVTAIVLSGHASEIIKTIAALCRGA